MTAKRTAASGLSKTKTLPSVLKYPKFLPFDPNQLKYMPFYIIRHYGRRGFSMIIQRPAKSDQVIVLIGDWDGNNIDLLDNKYEHDIINNFVRKHVSFFVNTMIRLGHRQAQFYFAIDETDTPILVDIQISMDKMVGPGMIKDLFSNTFPTQQILKFEILDDRALECITDGVGSYSGDIILKPSRFKFYTDPKTNTHHPMYIEVIR